MSEDAANKIQIYSPTQVATASFLGGPFATIFVLKKNFDAFGDRAHSKQTLLWGALFIVLLLVVLPILPDKFPNMVIPIAYTVTARELAKKYQMTKQAISESEQFGFRSNWNVLGISIGFFIAFLVIFLLWFLGLQAAGLIKTA
jgi:hypothetical protein